MLVLFAYPVTAFVVGLFGQVLRDTLVPSLPHTRRARLALHELPVRSDNEDCYEEKRRQ